MKLDKLQKEFDKLRKLNPVAVVVNALVLAAICAAIGSKHCEVAATLLIGLITADVIWWQGFLIKRQLAFSTFIEFDKEWNSHEMLEIRKHVREPDGSWDVSNLEGVLEFFEKLASFRIAGVVDFELIYNSTLGWYAARYWLFAREGDQIRRLRDEIWKDFVYGDLEEFYKEFLDREVGREDKKQKNWETKQKEAEATFWAQERKG
ncbi:MAG: hypothetical protein WBQ86_11755 [Candidatus Binatus sp.]